MNNPNLYIYNSVLNSCPNLIHPIFSVIRCAPVLRPNVLVKIRTCARILIRTLRYYSTVITSEEACVLIPNQDVFAARLEGFVHMVMQVNMFEFSVFERKNIPVNLLSSKPIFTRKKVFF